MLKTAIQLLGSFIPLVFFACQSTEHLTPTDGGADLLDQLTVSDQQAVSDQQTAVDGPEPNLANQAQIFAIDPVATPERQTVILEDVADDLEGGLTSAASADGLRKINVVSCVEKELASPSVFGYRKVCDLVQRANKYEHENFIYDDVDKTLQGAFDVDDIQAEVNLYYYATQYYDFVTSDKVGLFSEFPNRHDRNGKKVPLTLIANYRSPTTSSSESLIPADIAAFTPYENGVQGMWEYLGIPAQEGDVLYFGQSDLLDLSYAGETVYHELTHCLQAGVANGQIYNILVDQYGLSNEPPAINEGIAMTFPFLITGQTTEDKYLDKFKPGFAAYIDQSATFPKDINGMALHDGLIIANTNYLLFKRLQDEAGFTNYDFARVLLNTVKNFANDPANVTFQSYRDGFLAAVQKEVAANLVEELRGIFDQQGFSETVRAKDITAFNGLHPAEQMLILDGVGPNPPYTTVSILDDDGTTQQVAPAYVQTYIDVPATATSVKVGGFLIPASFVGLPTGEEIRVALLVRKDKPIQYDLTKSPVEVAYDAKLEPTITQQSTPSGTQNVVSWAIPSLDPGARYYLQVINYGPSSGMLVPLRVIIE